MKEGGEGEGHTEADDAVPPRDTMDDISLEPAVAIARVSKSRIYFDSPHESSGLPADFPDVFPAADRVSREAEETLCLIGIQVGSTVEPCCKVCLDGFHEISRGRAGAEGTAGAAQREGEEASGRRGWDGGRRAGGRNEKGAGKVSGQGMRKCGQRGLQRMGKVEAGWEGDVWVMRELGCGRVSRGGE